jgi:hypothetical protein
MTDFGPTPSSFPVPPPPPPLTRTGPPWENPGPPLQRFIDTMKGVLVDPMNTFANVRREGGLQAPLFYYLLGAAVALVGAILWHILLPGGGMMGMPGGRGAMAGAAMGLGFLIIVLPLCYIIGIFLGSLILHFLLMLFGGQKFPYETTFRAVAYAHGSALPLSFIPFCGGLIGGIWGIVVLIIGLAQMQETTIGKAAAAVLVPIVLCCGLIFVFAATIATMAGFAAAGAASGLH